MTFNRFSAAALACLLATALAGCNKTSSSASAPNSPAVAAIKAIEAKWAKDFASNDAADFASHYAADAVAMDAGTAPLVGRAAIEAGEKQAFADPAAELTFSSDKVVVAASGDMAVSHGTFAQSFTNPQTHAKASVNGQYVTVFKKQPDGSWQAIYDINTPSSGVTFGTPAQERPDRHRGHRRSFRRRRWR